MELLTQNGKMKKSSTGEYSIWNFGIPALKSKTGLKTCPMAGTCAKGCYAQQGAYNFGNVKPAFEARLETTLSKGFIPDMATAIASKMCTASKNLQRLVVRIHDSGDFYSQEYFRDWCFLASLFPDVKFYAYTKMIAMVQDWEGMTPDNLRIIMSYGGKQDAQIRPGLDRHCKVFKTLDELEASGYTDGTHDDLVAALDDTLKIGLVYHGVDSKVWEGK